MKAKTFTGNTSAEAKMAKDQWQAANMNANIKKEYPPIVMNTPSGRFTKKDEGKVISVSIRIDYED